MPADQLKQIDKDENNDISIQEIKKTLEPGGFLDSNKPDYQQSIKSLTEELNQSEDNKENVKLIESFKDSINGEIDDIIRQGEATEEDRLLVKVWEDLLGKGDPRVQTLEDLVNKKGDGTEVEISNEEESEKEFIKQIMEEINKLVEHNIGDEINNLKELGVDCNQIFNWKNLINDIKTTDDVQKINERNIINYIVIPPEIPTENYIYIVNNVRSIIKNHLLVNPKYKSILGGFASGMRIDATVKNDKYLESIYADVEKLIETKNEEEQVKKIIGKLRNGELSDVQYTHLWINKYLGEKEGEEQFKVLEKIFKEFTPAEAGKFLSVCDKDDILKTIKDSYVQYWLEENKCIYKGKAPGQGGDIVLLDFTKEDTFKNFLNHGCENFDLLYKYSNDFYESSDFKLIGLDKTIPVGEIINLLSSQSIMYEKIAKASEVKERRVNNELNNYNAVGSYQPVGGSPGAGHSALGGCLLTHTVHFKCEKAKACAELEEQYVKVLLQKKPTPKKDIPGISGAGIALKFSKDPGKGTLEERAKVIVRDTFNEQLGDERENFKYNLKNDKQAAFGNLCGMFAGIAASTVVGIFTEGNIWASAAAFTVASRVGNGVSQELWNAGEWVYEGISGNKIDNGFNQVDEFGIGFMRGIGAYEPVIDRRNGEPVKDKEGNIQYQFIGSERFLSNLTFDYLSGVAMFGAFKALGPAFEAIKSIKIVGKPLEFTVKWLFVQNFGIDMPMNALHTGFDTFFGIDSESHTGSIIYGHDKWDNNTGNNGMNLENGVGEAPEKYNFGDALDAMLNSIEEHLTFENQAQVFFNTLMYCGMLEAGQGFCSTIKAYMPATRIEKFERSGAKFQKAQNEFVSEIQKKGLELNKDFKLVDSKTKKPLKLGDPRFMEFTPALMKLKIALHEHTMATQELIESERVMSKDGKNKYSLIRNIGLLSDKQPPLNILKEKIIEAKKIKLQSEKTGDIKKVEELDKLIEHYEMIQTVLIAEAHPSNRKNANLNNGERIEKAKELLKKENLSQEQQDAIIEAHNKGGAIYTYDIIEIRAKVEILKKAGFTREEIRILMENCICGRPAGSEGGPVNQGEKEKLNYEKEIFNRAKKIFEKEHPDTKYEKATAEEKLKYENLAKEQYKEQYNIAEKGAQEAITEYLNQASTRYYIERKGEINKSIGDMEEVYKQKLTESLLGKPEAQRKGIIEEFNLRFSNALDFIVSKGESITYLGPDGKLKQGSIDDYGKSLLGENFKNDPAAVDMFNEIKRNLFLQDLDNPLKFCGHGGKHSIFVDRYVQNILNDIGKENFAEYIKNELEMPEGVEISLESAIILARFTAVFHDFGYPELLNGMEKANHGPLGGKIFIDRFVKGENSLLKRFMEQSLKITDKSVQDKITKTLCESVFFHSADKVEQGFTHKIICSYGEYLVNTTESLNGLFDIICENGETLTISYRKGNVEGRKQAESLENSIKEYCDSKGKKLETKIVEDGEKKPYDNSSEFDKCKDNTQYWGRELKIGDSGIEFKPIDLVEKPLEGIVRLADNMDMSVDRLTEMQTDPVFLNMFYSMGFNESGKEFYEKDFMIEKVTTYDVANALDYMSEIGKNINKIFENHKEYFKENNIDFKGKTIEEKVKTIKDLVNNGEITLDKKDNITISDFDIKYNKAKNLLNEPHTLEINLYNTKTGIIETNITPFEMKFEMKGEDYGKAYQEFKKQLVKNVESVCKKNGIEYNVNYVDIITDLSSDGKIGSYSFRHFIGLTSIQDVSITVDVKGRPSFKVLVDIEKHFNSTITGQQVTEKGGTYNLVEYHIWRLFDATRTVTYNGKPIEIDIYDASGTVKIGEVPATATAKDFKVIYNSGKLETSGVNLQQLPGNIGKNVQ